MTVFYDKNNKVVYRCTGAITEYAGKICQSIMGLPIEEAVFHAAAQALSDTQFRQVIALRAQQLLEAGKVQPALLREGRRLEAAVLAAKANYSAAQDRGLDQRLLAELERDWLGLHIALEDYKRETLKEDTAPSLKTVHSKMLNSLKDDFKAFWASPNVKSEVRIALLRTVIRDIEIVKGQEQRKIFVVINWHSQTSSVLVLDDTQYLFVNHPIPQSTIDLIVELGATHNRHAISARLNTM